MNQTIQCSLVGCGVQLLADGTCPRCNPVALRPEPEPEPAPEPAPEPEPQPEPEGDADNADHDVALVRDVLAS